MNPKKYFLLAICITVLTNISTGQQRKAKPEEKWPFVLAPIFGVSTADSASKAWGDNSAKYYTWRELYYRQFRDNGATFFEQHSSDPSFAKWFKKTTNDMVPSYWPDVEKEAAKMEAFRKGRGAYAVNRDKAAINNWQSRYLAFRARYLANTSISSQDKQRFLNEDLPNNMFRLAAEIYSGGGNLDERFASMRPIIDRYCAEAVDRAYREQPDYQPLQIALNDFGSHDTLLAKSLYSILKQAKDTTVSASAADEENRLNHLRKEAVNLKVPSLTGGASIDLEKLRGKVVLLEFWNPECHGCIAAMPKYERMYKLYHNKGFELVSVCVFWDSAARAAQHPEALAIQKKLGVTYTSGEITAAQTAKGEIDWDQPAGWKEYGNAYGGGAFLLDQQGHLVCTDQLGQWLEFNIRKTLKLSVEEK